MDYRDSGIDSDGDLVKQELNKIRKELASTIYCSAMISELRDKEEDNVDFYNDCNSLSSALTKIYAMRFKANPVDEIDGMVNSEICNKDDLVVVSNALRRISESTKSKVVMAIMSGCSSLTKSIVVKIGEVHGIE